MMLAKLEPGSFNSPYVAASNTIPVAGMNFEVARNQSTAWTYDTPGGGFVKVGSRAYTLIAYCPALSCTTNTSGNRLSGYVSMVTDNPLSHTLSPYHFVDTGSNVGISQIGLLGSDASNFASGTMVWASAIDMGFTIPAANVSGIAYQGSIQWRQLFDKNGVATSIDVGTLMKLATTVTKMTTEEAIQVTLKSAVVNNDLMFDH